MRPWIIQHFPKTEEAVLIDKWFKGAFEDSVTGRVHGLALEGKEKQMLDMARELEREEQEKKNK